MILDRFKLTDRVVLITGAGRGIGAGCAQACAEAGAHVALTARTVSQLEEVGDKVRAQGRKALIFPADVNDLDTLEAFVAATIEEFGRIDTVINNAGGSMPAPFMDTSTEMFEKAFHFNVTTAFSLSQHALPHLLETGGSIVNISSTMGRIREPHWLI